MHVQCKRPTTAFEGLKLRPHLIARHCSMCVVSTSNVPGASAVASGVGDGEGLSAGGGGDKIEGLGGGGLGMGGGGKGGGELGGGGL